MGRQVVTTYLDTNIVIYMHRRDLARLTKRASEQLEDSELLISGMVILELEMLYEKGRINYSGLQMLSDLNERIVVSICQLPMGVVMQSAIGIKRTGEPGDRIIVANAVANTWTVEEFRERFKECAKKLDRDEKLEPESR